MSEIKVNKISPRTNCGTVTLGDSGDTFTIPSGATITNAGTASGFGATGEISWDTTVKTTGTFTATAGVGYFCNTSGGTITVNLPAGAAGSSVAMADYAGTWQNNKVTVAPNGSEKMGGVATSVELTTQGQSVTFVYIDGTQGWVNVLDSTSNVRGSDFIEASGGNQSPSCGLICGDYKTHIFTSPGTFTVTAVSSATPANNVVDYVVAGGGGGSQASPAGGNAGGGAGGFRLANSLGLSAPTMSPLAHSTGITVSATPYPIAVGGGATNPPSAPGSGAPAGSVSTFDSITSAGGGGGGNTGVGNAGGSGGGGSQGPTPTSGYAGGAGNNPPVSPPQGNPGGAGYDGLSSTNNGGGGGGAGATGSNAGPATGGAGGVGSFIAPGFIGPTAPSYGTTGPASGRYFAGGGGGSSDAPGTQGAGGAGGGGIGGTSACGNGTPNTGGGSGGGAPTGGGSGIVMIRYKFQ